MCFLLADTLKIFREEVFTQNLYNIVACLSFLGTGYLFICRWLSSRKNIKTSIIDHAKVFGRIVQFFISFQNQSTAPLTVHSVAIVYAAKEYPCELIPKKSEEKTNVQSIPLCFLLILLLSRAICAILSF